MRLPWTRPERVVPLVGLIRSLWRFPPPGYVYRPSQEGAGWGLVWEDFRITVRCLLLGHDIHWSVDSHYASCLMCGMQWAPPGE